MIHHKSHCLIMDLCISNYLSGSELHVPNLCHFSFMSFPIKDFN